MFWCFSGTTLGSKAYPTTSGISGMTMVGGININNSMGLHPTNKFNTISNVHKRGGGNGRNNSVKKIIFFSFQAAMVLAGVCYLMISMHPQIGSKWIIMRRVGLCSIRGGTSPARWPRPPGPTRCTTWGPWAGPARTVRTVIRTTRWWTVHTAPPGVWRRCISSNNENRKFNKFPIYNF